MVGGQPSTRARHANPGQGSVTLTITPDSRIYLDKTQVTLDQLAPTLKTMMSDPDASIIVAADSSAPNGITVQAMLRHAKRVRNAS